MCPILYCSIDAHAEPIDEKFVLALKGPVEIAYTIPPSLIFTNSTFPATENIYVLCRCTLKGGCWAAGPKPPSKFKLKKKNRFF